MIGGDSSSGLGKVKTTFFASSGAVIGVIFSSILTPALRLHRLRGLGLEAVDEALQMGAPGLDLLRLGLHGAAFGHLRANWS
jgi:hypothetical protein